MNKPKTSIDLVLPWMRKAAITCTEQGRSDSAQLWRDAIEHIEYLAPLENENRCLAALIGKYSPAGIITEDDYKWARKVLNI